MKVRGSISFYSMARGAFRAPATLLYAVVAILVAQSHAIIHRSFLRCSGPMWPHGAVMASRDPLLLACLLAAMAAGVAAASIRGLDPALAAAYRGTGGEFACLDGKKSVPFTQVNDDYCDCFDGSDEPGAVAPACQ